MEDVLEVYHRPRDMDFPLVCLDESSKQLLADTREPVPMEKGRPARSDHEYKRNGTANVFMVFAPLEGRRHVTVTDQRTAIDYAHMLKTVADELFPDPKRSCWSRTILTPTNQHRCMKRFRPQRRAVSSSALNGTTPQSTAAGSIWPNRSLACWLSSASIAEFPTAKPSPRKSSRGNHIETNTTPKLTGSSQPKMRVSS